MTSQRPAPPPAAATARRHGLVLALFALLTVALSWPLALQLTTHVPGIPQWAFDESTFLWNIWHFKHTVIDQLVSPLHSELIWFPLGIDLILYTYNFYHVLAALPLLLAGGNLPLVSNLTLWQSTLLSGYGAYLLAHWLLRKEEKSTGAGHPLAREIAAFAAGAIFAFASNRAVYAALGHYDMVTTQWIPFYALMLLRALDGELSPARRRKAALLAGIFFALTGLAEMISALFLAIFTIIVLLARPMDESAGDLSPSGTLWLRLSRWLRPLELALLGITAFVLWSPVLIPIAREFFTGNYDLKGWGDALMLSADLKGWFTATIFHPLFGADDVVRDLRLVQERAANPALSGFRDVNTVFFGWVTAALALAGALLWRRRGAVWSLTTLVFGLLTLGPLLQINGQYLFDFDGLQTSFPLPFLLLHFLPVVKANRAPNRNSVLLMLGLAVLAGYGLYRLLAWLGARDAAAAWPRRAQVALGSVVVAALLFEHLALPAPLSDHRIPELYATVAADPRPVSVLQLPLGWRNSFGVFGPEQTQLQFFQTGHGKPMLGGNISRAPDFKLEYFQRLPFFQALTDLEFGRTVTPETLAAAEAQAVDLMALYNVGYVVLMPPIPGRPPYTDSWQASWEFIKRTVPLAAEPFFAGDGIEAYQVELPPAVETFALDLGGPGTFAYRGEGWDAAEEGVVEAESGPVSAIWATATESRFFATLARPTAATYTLSVRALPYRFPDAPAQAATLLVNGRALAAQPVGDGWQTLTWEVPGDRLQEGLNRFALRWAYAAAPRLAEPVSRQIGTTGIELPVDADLRAFADGAFMALFPEEGGQPAAQMDASAGRAGVNVTLLAPDTGAILDKQGFDTTANAFESERLAAYLDSIEPGAIVLVATRGDAGAFLSQAAVDGLGAVGAALDLATAQTQQFLVVGVKGASPGSAAQATDPADAFLRISRNRDYRTLAAAVDGIWMERR